MTDVVGTLPTNPRVPVPDDPTPYQMRQQAMQFALEYHHNHNYFNVERLIADCQEIVLYLEGSYPVDPRTAVTLQHTNLGPADPFSAAA